MKRRTFLQALLALSGVPLVRLPKPALDTSPIRYVDSQGTPPDQLLVLADDNRQTGITYQP